MVLSECPEAIIGGACIVACADWVLCMDRSTQCGVERSLRCIA
jgi:hypothetical protein